MAWEEQTAEKKAIWEKFTMMVTVSTVAVLVVLALMAVLLL